MYGCGPGPGRPPGHDTLIACPGSQGRSVGRGSLGPGRSGTQRPAARRADGRQQGNLRDCNRRGLVTVHFIGAGPGAPDLITVRGRDLIGSCPVCLYAGSLVPRALLEYCPPIARIVDTAPLSLDGIADEFARANAAGQDVARLHSGDLSVWSAMGEQ